MEISRWMRRGSWNQSYKALNLICGWSRLSKETSKMNGYISKDLRVTALTLNFFFIRLIATVYTTHACPTDINSCQHSSPWYPLLSRASCAVISFFLIFFSPHLFCPYSIPLCRVANRALHLVNLSALSPLVLSFSRSHCSVAHWRWYGEILCWYLGWHIFASYLHLKLRLIHTLQKNKTPGRNQCF